MFENIGKETRPKKTHKDASVKPKKSLKPFKEGSDGFTRSTISIPNDFGRFLHEEVLHVGIKKKQMTKVIMELLEEKYGKKFMEWKNEQ